MRQKLLQVFRKHQCANFGTFKLLLIYSQCLFLVLKRICAVESFSSTSAKKKKPIKVLESVSQTE